MNFKIILILIVASILVLGCIKKETKHSNRTPIITPTVKGRSYTEYNTTQYSTVSTINTSKITTIVKTNIKGNVSSSTLLKTPLGVEYEWINLNKTLEISTTNGICETGIFGKMYVPKEIKPDRKYPIYLLLSRNPKVSKFASLLGVTLCISPSFVYDIPNKKLDLYLHIGIGAVVVGYYCWDKLIKHWFIKNIYKKSGFNFSCKIDNKLYMINLSELKPNEWQVYKIYLIVKTPKENSNVALRQSLKNEIYAESYNGFWTSQNNKVGLWITKLKDNEYLAELYLNELNLRVCAPGLGIVFGTIPPSVELWIHAGFGINKWDFYLRHILITEHSLVEKPQQSSWKRIDVFKIRYDKLRPYIASVETIENGNFEGVAISNEKIVREVYPVLYCIRVKGTLVIDNIYQKFVNTTLYYTEKREFRKGEKIVGFVKLVTIKTTEKPIIYLSAIGNGYWVSKVSPWITNVTTQTTIANVTATANTTIANITAKVIQTAATSN